MIPDPTVCCGASKKLQASLLMLSARPKALPTKTEYGATDTSYLDGSGLHFKIIRSVMLSARLKDSMTPNNVGKYPIGYKAKCNTCDPQAMNNASQNYRA
jgi:hypothetical protein